MRFTFALGVFLLYINVHVAGVEFSSVSWWAGLAACTLICMGIFEAVDEIKKKEDK